MSPGPVTSSAEGSALVTCPSASPPRIQVVSINPRAAFFFFFKGISEHEFIVKTENLKPENLCSS